MLESSSPVLVALALAAAGSGLAGAVGRADVPSPPRMTIEREADPAPPAAPASATTAARRPTAKLARADDGLFYVTARIDGVAVRFLVDTGSSVVMLTRADAARAGLPLADSAFRTRVLTANGPSAVAWIRLGKVSVAGHEVAGVEAAVPRGGLPVSLLGQNLLARIGPLTLDGESMDVAAGPG